MLADRRWFSIIFLLSLWLICFRIVTADGSTDLGFLEPNTTICYSCIGTPKKFTNFTEIVFLQYLRLYNIPILNVIPECRETEFWDIMRYQDVPKFLCESAACVKIKGIYQQDVFVIRECWERLWGEPPDVERTCSYFEQMPDSELCVCEGDLCNTADQNSVSFSKMLFWITFFLVVYCATSL